MSVSPQSASDGGLRRPTVDEVFVNANAPRSPSRSEVQAAAPLGRRVRSVAPSPLDAPAKQRKGLGLLVVGGVMGSLSALSRLPVMIVGDSHVRCIADPSRYALAPCEEQAVGHKAAFVASSVLLAGALPMLGTGSRIRGRYVTEHRHGNRTLAKVKARQRLGTGLGLLGVGIAAMAASYPLAGPVAFGHCSQTCRARFFAAEVTWWTGSFSLAAGAVLVGHTVGRRRRPKSRSTFLPGPGAGASWVGRF